MIRIPCMVATLHDQHNASGPEGGQAHPADGIVAYVNFPLDKPMER